MDRCLVDGIEREHVADALVRMAEAVQSGIAEERPEYSVVPDFHESFDQVRRRARAIQSGAGQNPHDGA